MKKPLRLVEITHLNLVPVATVGVTFTRLRDFGIQFEYGTDDLDDYAIAAFDLAGEGVFALSRYIHATSEDCDLLLDEHSASEPKLSSMIRCVAKELDLPGSSFRWMVNGQPARLVDDQAAPLSQHA